MGPTFIKPALPLTAEWKKQPQFQTSKCKKSMWGWLLKAHSRSTLWGRIVEKKGRRNRSCSNILKSDVLLQFARQQKNQYASNGDGLPRTHVGNNIQRACLWRTNTTRQIRQVAAEVDELIQDFCQMASLVSVMETRSFWCGTQLVRILVRIRNHSAAGTIHISKLWPLLWETMRM